jgi:FkbM family methyltransferase
MRPALLYNPRLLCERLAEWSVNRRRLAQLRGTVANKLQLGHIDSLELLNLLKAAPPAVIYDIGAYIGTWSLLAKAIFPDAEIHAFEPMATHRERFKDFTGCVPKLYLHEVGLGEASVPVPMTVLDNSDASSLLEMTNLTKIHHRSVRIEEVRIERLDSWARENKIPLPDLIKLDIQGYELNALRGGEGCLEHARAVLSEVSFREFYSGQCLFHDVVTFLADRSFHVYAFGASLIPGRRLDQTDVLFVKVRE